MKKNFFIATCLLLTSVISYSYTEPKLKKSGECTIAADTDSTNEFKDILGVFDINKIVSGGDAEQLGFEYGELQVDAYDAANKSYAKKTTSVQVEIRKEESGLYQIEMWGMIAGRKSEVKVKVEAKQLPEAVHLSELGSNVASAQEQLGRTRVTCKAVLK